MDPTEAKITQLMTLGFIITFEERPTDTRRLHLSRGNKVATVFANNGIPKALIAASRIWRIKDEYVPPHNPTIREWALYNDSPSVMKSWMSYWSIKTMNHFWETCDHPGWLIWILEREFSSSSWENGHGQLSALIYEFRESLEKVNPGSEIIPKPSIHAIGLKQPPPAVRIKLCKKIRASFHPEGYRANLYGTLNAI